MVTTTNRPNKYIMVMPFVTAFIILLFFIPFNRYIMHEANVPYLLLLLITIGFAEKIETIPKKLLISNISFYMLIFICYMILRKGDNVGFYSMGIIKGLNSAVSEITIVSLHFALFMVVALLYHKRESFSITLWFLICGYLIAFVIRNSIDFEALKSSYRLSPGYVIYSLLPFIFFKKFNNQKFMRMIPYILLIFFTIWLFLLGNRQPVIAMLVFLGTIFVWPKITKSKFVFYSTFWLIIVLLLVLTVGYVYLIAINSIIAEKVNDAGIYIMNRDIYSRFNVWSLILLKIKEKVFFGYGVGVASSSFSPPTYIDINRNSLASHSLYLELLVRVGLVGLVGYLLIFFNILKFYWTGREKWVVRIAGSFLLSSLFYSSLGTYWIFTVHLQSAFAWIVLGIGVGACLQKEKSLSNQSVTVI